MSLPKNRSIRKIIVNGVEYYWRISVVPFYKRSNTAVDALHCIIGLVEQPEYYFYTGVSKWDEYNHTNYQYAIAHFSPHIIKELIIYANNNVDWKNSSPTFVTLAEARLIDMIYKEYTPKEIESDRSLRIVNYIREKTSIDFKEVNVLNDIFSTSPSNAYYIDEEGYIGLKLNSMKKYANKTFLVIAKNTLLKYLSISGQKMPHSYHLDFLVLKQWNSYLYNFESYLRDLHKLSLKNNLISSISNLSELKALTHLNLNENNITDITPLISLHNLKQLSIRQNQVVDISPLYSLENIEYLNLSVNKIEQIDWERLSKMKKLQEFLEYWTCSNLGRICFLFFVS